MAILNNKLRRVLAPCLATALMLGSSAVLAQSTSIPASLEGTYSLTFGSAQTGAPLANGTTVDMVIAAGGTVCIADLVLSNPTVSGAEATWGIPALGVKLAVSNVTTGTFNEANVLSTSGNLLGQFTGSKTSNSTSCALLGGTPPDMSQVSNLIAKAEELYADLFPSTATNTAFSVLDGYVYRFYDSTGIYIGIKNNTVYVQGGAFGDGAPVTIGTVANTLAELTGQPVDPVDEPVVEVPDGDYTLTIAGTVSTSGVSTPFTFEIDSIPAPGNTEIDSLEDDVRKALDDAEGVDASTFSSFQISEVSVTDDRVFYRARFSATTTTQTVIGPITTNVAYNLTFEYRKK
ncbi:hypothetical protein [Pseudohongiella sp.]|uniref:Uncharacterized protein n=1 Tax=marine sediment metagenome TaxID=412755 RepID=A0A0F9Z303_9ZZZZ|nr:hypothetical protein [Pseudohongiella sp.]HDZ09260.1 hypothetical protein [Pseudohongiella sp.]HEA62124.1 hypothetical protein [Pseudohongiella sp.]